MPTIVLSKYVRSSTFYSIALHGLGGLSIVLLASLTSIAVIEPRPQTSHYVSISVPPLPNPPIRPKPAPQEQPITNQAESAEVHPPAPVVRTGFFDRSRAPEPDRDQEAGVLRVGKWNLAQPGAGPSQSGTIRRAGLYALGTGGSQSQPSAAGGEPAADSPARLLADPKPVYTDEARRLHVTGVVMLEVILTAAGTVQVVGVFKSLGHGLDEAAIAAVDGARCRPAMHSGKPMKTRGYIRINFQLA